MATPVLIGYCLVIATASLLGGWLPTRLRLTHTRVQVMMSFVGGFMMAVALLHLLPHATHHLHSLDRAAAACVLGLLLMFFFIRVFHVHQHAPVEVRHDQQYDEAGHPAEDSSIHSAAHHHHHDHDHDHDHDSGGAHTHSHSGQAPASGGNLRWVALAAGLSLHTILDGVALGASVALEDGENASPWALAGVATFGAIVLHKPIDALSITSMMISSGWSSARQRLVNVGFALMCPIGALLFYLGVREFITDQQTVVGVALGVAAGMFLCISLADLLPEIQFHSHDIVKLSIALLLGVALAWGVGFLEPPHDHGDHDRPPAAFVSPEQSLPPSPDSP